MHPTEILSHEHRVIEHVLGALESAAARIDTGQPIRPGFFLDAAEFISGFADGCHHQKEEGLLFEALASNGLSKDQGPVAVMLAEHEMGREFTRGMRSAAQRWAAGDESAKTEVATYTRNYAALLRQHIVKEDNILFPMADRMLPASQQAQLVAAFDRFEEEETGAGAHEKFHALAEQLEQEVQ
jgi:hemerythrin-like domain-containing protein